MDLKTTSVVACIVFGVSAGLFGAHKIQDHPRADSTTTALGKDASDKTGKETSDSIAEYAVLFKLDGNWKVEENYPPRPNVKSNSVGTGNALFKKKIKDTFLIGDYLTKCKDLDYEVEAHIVMTYDSVSQKFRYWWFDNWGNALEFNGKYDKNANTLIFTNRTLDPDTKEISLVRHTYTFKSDDEIVLKVEIGNEDKLDSKVTITFSKKGSATKKEDDKSPTESTTPKPPSKPAPRPPSGGM